MSTAARLQQATESLKTITTTHAQAVAAERDAGAALLEFKRTRDSSQVNMIRADQALALLSSIADAERRYAAAAREREALADLLVKFTEAHAAADLAHEQAKAIDARPAAHEAIDVAVQGLKAWAVQLHAAIDAATRGGLPTTGEVWAGPFNDALRACKLHPATFSRRK